MISFTDVISTVAVLYGQFFEEDIVMLNEQAISFSSLSDEELKQKCSERNFMLTKEDVSVWNYIVKHFSFLKKTDRTTIQKLALGVAAFNKCPADLDNTELYYTQIKAALALTHSCVVQMDTGEGKTYALLPAAYALTCKYGKVYILCANEYLAQRDAIRTKNYWDFVGLEVQFCSSNDNYNSDKWQGDVIYTTLTALMFKGIADDINIVPYEKKLSLNAIIIDEIDAVLFDEYSTFSRTIPINSMKVFNWDIAIQYAKSLAEDEDIYFDKGKLSSSLSVLGEDKFKKYLSDLDISISQYGQYKIAVEIAFVSLNVEENKDYVIKNETIYAVNRINGEIEYNRTYDWIIPLEIQQGKKPRPHRVTLHEADSRVFLSQFEHVSGMSGTVKEDAAEYFYTYLLPTAIVKPRIERQKQGELLDEIYMTQREGIIVLCDKIIDGIKKNRPVLVGTQTIKEAQSIFYTLIEKLEKISDININLNLITGQTEKDIAGIYKNGGEVGSVIIATQIAGRGVDIRLSAQARNNGGLVLLGFERAMDLRHDRQFLGRAGRQGDPYTSQFIITLEGHLMKLFAGKKVQKMLKFLGIEEGQCIESNIVSTRIVQAQKRVRESEFINRRANDYQYTTDKEIYNNIKNWFSHLNVENDVDQFLPKSFIHFVINHFIKYNLSNLIHRNLNMKEAVELVSIINHITTIDPIRIEGREEDYVNNYIHDSLYNKLIEKWKSNEVLFNKTFLLFGYIRKPYRYQFICSRINQIKKLPRSKKYGTHSRISGNCYDREYEKIVSQISVNGSLAIHSISDLKQLYALLGFLGKHLSNLSGSKYSQAIHLIKQFDRNWYAFYRKIAGDCIKLHNRTPYHIARWTILQAGICFRDYKSIILHSLIKQEMNVLHFNRVLSDKLISEWDKIENSLSANILMNFLANPLSLDKLFLYNDNQVNDHDHVNENEDLINEWDSVKGSTTQKEKDFRASIDQNLISEFIAQSKIRNESGFHFGIPNLERILERFLEISPINTMQSPDKIITALENWKRDEIILGITSERQKLHYKWIKHFLVFLSKKRVIALLPSFKHKYNAVLSKIVKNINDYKIVVPITNLSLWGVLFGLLSVFCHWYKPINSNFLGILIVDNLLCAGWLSAGIITGPVFLLYLSSSYPTKGFAVTKYLFCIVCAFLFSFITIDPNSFGKLLLTLLFGLLISAFYITLVDVIVYIDRSLNLSLISAWLIFCCLNVLFSSTLISSISPKIIFSAIALYYCLIHRKINQDEIILMSTHIKDSYNNLESDIQKIVRVVDGNIKSIPHVYAFIFSFLVYIILNYFPSSHTVYNEYIVILSYMLILLLLTRELITKRLLISSWEKSLNLKGQIIINKLSDSIEELDLESTLTTTKHKLLRIEIVIQVIVAMACVSLLKDYKLYDSNYPLSMFILFSAFLFGEHIIKFLEQLSQLIIFRGQIVNETLDFKNIKDPNEVKTIFQKIQDYFTPLNMTRKFLNFLFMVALIIYGVWQILNLFK